MSFTGRKSRSSIFCNTQRGLLVPYGVLSDTRGSAITPFNIGNRYTHIIKSLDVVNDLEDKIVQNYPKKAGAPKKAGTVFRVPSSSSSCKTPGQVIKTVVNNKRRKVPAAKAAKTPKASHGPISSGVEQDTVEDEPKNQSPLPGTDQEEEEEETSKSKPSNDQDTIYEFDAADFDDALS